MIMRSQFFYTSFLLKSVLKIYFSLPLYSRDICRSKFSQIGDFSYELQI